MIKCPYGELELKIALAGLELSDERAEAITADLDALSPMEPLSMADYNRAAADFHGVDVATLVASASYATLIEAFKSHLLEKAIEIFVRHGHDHKQAWALLVFGLREAGH